MYVSVKINNQTHKFIGLNDVDRLDKIKEVEI
jgi:hypothetical protein